MVVRGLLEAMMVIIVMEAMELVMLIGAMSFIITVMVVKSLVMSCDDGR